MEISCVQTASYRDFEEFAASVPGGSAELTPLHPDGFSSEIIELRLGDILLRAGRITPLVEIGSVNPASVWIVLPLGRHGTLRLNGRMLGPGDVAVYGPGASHQASIHHNTSWALVMLPATAVDALLHPPRRSLLRRPGAHAVLRINPDLWKRAASLVRAAAEVAVRDPEVFAVAEARRSLRSSLLGVLHELLAGPFGGTPPRALRTSPARQWVVRTAEDYLRANPCWPISTGDLCAAIGVSPSCLRAAFAATFSISPKRYLRLRRLALVRSALRAPNPQWPSVAQAATAYGFWDLELFIRQYQDLFGEAPSTTLRRSGANIPA